jgi:hypothetical protein
MIDPLVREKAARICEAASKDEAASLQSYVLTASQIGLDVVYDEATDDGTGLDMDAVNLAAIAWLKIDKVVPGLEWPRDLRRDTAAAEQLRNGWNPDE